MRNWELIIINRFFKQKKKKNGREVFTETQENVTKHAKKIYRKKLNVFQRIIYTYRVY